MFERLKHLWQLVYAVAIVYLHGLMLDGPMLLGPRAFGIKLIAAGLGAYVGTALASAVLNAPTKNTKREKTVALVTLGATAAVAAIAFLTHGTYFDGTQTNFSSREIWIYRVSIFALALLMRAFLASLLAVRAIEERKQTKGSQAPKKPPAS